MTLARSVVLLVLSGAAAVPAVVHAEPTLSYLHTFGPAGDPGNRLGWGLGIISVLVIVVITVLLLAAIVRRRAAGAEPSALAVHRDEGGMRWIYVGVGISTAVLIGCAVWTMFTLAAIAMPAKAADLTLDVTAAQWWWSVRYKSREPSHIFTTANEIHIPVGQPVRIELTSHDVIHSFWIPQLGGKMDVIPGQTNVTWLQADSPGIYRGQCGEFCGAQHAHMAMYVIADSPQDYVAWERHQLADATIPSSTLVRDGASAFIAHCAACHAVRGGSAGGIVGPDLTHLMSRHTIAAGLLPNTPGNLAAWIADSQALKPGSRMPTLALSGPELASIVTYLQTLN